MRNLTTMVLTAVALTAVLATTAEARQRHHRHSRCDGVHGCLCGVTAARLNGLSLNYRGYNLKRAADYKAALPHIPAPVPGAIVYQTRHGGSGHVSTIRQVLDRCTAVVQDEKGTYRRDICKRGATYLMPS